MTIQYLDAQGTRRLLLVECLPATADEIAAGLPSTEWRDYEDRRLVLLADGWPVFGGAMVRAGQGVTINAHDHEIVIEEV